MSSPLVFLRQGGCDWTARGWDREAGRPPSIKKHAAAMYFAKHRGDALQRMSASRMSATFLYVTPSTLLFFVQCRAMRTSKVPSMDTLSVSSSGEHLRTTRASCRACSAASTIFRCFAFVRLFKAPAFNNLQKPSTVLLDA